MILSCSSCVLLCKTYIYFQVKGLLALLQCFSGALTQLPKLTILRVLVALAARPLSACAQQFPAILHALPKELQLVKASQICKNPSQISLQMPVATDF